MIHPPKLSKVMRDRLILNYLAKFKICSRNQLAYMVFNQNTNPINVCNRTMKRLSLNGACLPVHQSRDKTYLYTLNPSTIHHKSNKIDHCLKIVDFYIHVGMPEKCLVEPIFGKYEPDLFFTDQSNKNICVEIQLTPISHKKMQQKINDFVSEFNVHHDSKTFVLCSDTEYKQLTIPKDFRLIKQKIPLEKFSK